MRARNMRGPGMRGSAGLSTDGVCNAEDAEETEDTAAEGEEGVADSAGESDLTP